MIPSENIKVVVRCRPLIAKESSNADSHCVTVKSLSNEIILHAPSDNQNRRENNKIFNYDIVFDQTHDQEKVYEGSAFSLVESVMEGFNGTIFAYGQTSSGKTFTMMGDEKIPILKGIIPRSFDHIMSIIDSSSDDKQFILRCSFLEIYNEEVHDLLTHDKKAKCELREAPQKGFYVKDLTQILIHSISDLNKLKTMGNNNKAVGETNMNEKSSRSHTVFTIYVESSVQLENAKETRVSAGKLNLVDLAGSERQNKAMCTNERFKESVKINLSLSALGNVISSLAEGKSSHIPYRDSKLTKLLQDSLGGNTKTVMIANISPAESNYEETVGTLRYASRTKMIKNKPKINEDPKDALIRMYLEEIRKLKEKLGEGIDFDVDKMRTLLEENKILAINQEKLAGELKEKELLFNTLNLEKKDFSSANENVILKGHANEEEIKKLDQMRKKLKKQKKIQEEITIQKEKQEEELNLFDHKFKSIQEEVEALRKANKCLWEKYKDACYEIEDMRKEHEYEKENLLDTIRDQEKEIFFYEDLSDMVFTKEEINNIRSHTIWSEYSERYKIPPFLFKDKEIKFPNLSYLNGIDLIKNNKQSRDFEIVSSDEEEKVEIKKIETEETSLPTFKPKQTKPKIKPVKIILKNDKNDVQLIEKRQYTQNIVMEDLTSPSLADRTRAKKEYLKAIDTMINSFTKKYSKERIIVPQNISSINSQSFTDFKDFEMQLDIQTIKAKSNLNNLLDPIPNPKSQSIMKELINENPFIKNGTTPRPLTFNRKHVNHSPKSVALLPSMAANNFTFSDAAKKLAKLPKTLKK